MNHLAQDVHIAIRSLRRMVLKRGIAIAATGSARQATRVDPMISLRAE